ncbi:hypothetical protein GCM10020216_087180 [Nonomuraea helvata]
MSGVRISPNNEFSWGAKLGRSARCRLGAEAKKAEKPLNGLDPESIHGAGGPEPRATQLIAMLGSARPRGPVFAK